MYQYYNPYMSQYNQPQYAQTQYAPQQYQFQTNEPDVLNGKIVDSLEVVKAINADLSGKPNYYPKSDGTEIYCKRINPQTGASGIQTYILKPMDEPASTTSADDGLLKLKNELIEFISNEINEVKNLVSTPKYQNKGGVK